MEQCPKSGRKGSGGIYVLIHITRLSQNHTANGLLRH